MQSDVLNVIRTAQENDIIIELENGSLSLKTELGEIDAAFLGIIRENKEAIIKYLAKLQKKETNEHNAIKEKVTRFDRDAVKQIPLSYSQERLWFIDKMQSSVQYHIPVVVSIKGTLNRDVFEKTFRKIVDRHEVLRSVYKEDQGVGYQEVIRSSDWVMQYEKADSDELLREKLQAFLSFPFDLAKDYMFRACLYERKEGEYVLATVFHHIASDGWSSGILLREFGEIYSAYSKGAHSRLPPLAFQYSDYAVWQRKFVSGEYLDNQLQYWEKKLGGAAVLELPADHLRPAIQGPAGDLVLSRLDEELVTRLRAVCKEEGVTMYMLMLAAFNVLLYRYSGQDDISVGTPVAGRSHSELDNMIGFFVNTLVIRNEFSGKQRFRDFLLELKASTLDAFEHQAVPFEKVVERVVKERDMSVNPLFQVMFTLNNASNEEVEMETGDLFFSGYKFKEGTSKFDLILVVNEGPDYFTFKLNYSTELFNKDTIQRMSAHFEKIVRSIADNRNTTLDQLAILTAPEKQQLLNEFNSNTVDFPREKTVAGLFEEQVARTPGNIAVACDNLSLTYAELDYRINQYAEHFANAGVKAGMLVPVFMERGIDMIISIFAILKLRAAYVPVDTDFPAARVAYMLENTEASVVITQAAYKGILPGSGITIISTDDEQEAISTYPGKAPGVQPQPDDLAYMIYTSGSTGNPKGVLIEHKGMLNHLYAKINELGVTDSSIIAQTASYTFDISVWQMFCALVTGGKTIVYRDDLLLKPVSLLQTLENDGVTIWECVPSYLTAVFSLNETLPALSSLNYLLVTGEAVSKSLMEKWFSVYPGKKVVNAYGPTEASDDICHYVMSKAPVQGFVPIGKPVQNMKIYIVDEAGNLCPVGIKGELCVSGIGVGRGYWKDAVKTGNSFVANPFDKGEGFRMYKTGDIARWLPDGNIEFMGRKDEQVKIRGYRIELGEVEHALETAAGVQQAVVIAKADASGIKRLVAYLVTEEGVYDKAAVIDHLQSKLPDYMIPQILVEMDVIPVTANGKIDKKRLPNPDMGDLSSKVYVAPQTSTEEQLAQIWIELLGVEKVGIDDSFFELGGHSLLATRLVSMVRSRMDTELPIKDIFKHVTLSSLAAHIAGQQKGALLPLVTTAAPMDKIPLSYSQERLWFIDKFQGSVQYHIPIVLGIKGDLDKQVLEQSLQLIVSRHEVLRTVLKEDEGEGYQEVTGSDDWKLEFDAADGEDILKEKISTLIATPFDLSKDYMLRGCLYDRGNDEYVLAVVFHHIASDGWSNAIVINEFVEIYNAYKRGLAPELPPLSLQYSDYAVWQRRHISGEFLEAQLSYWDKKLSGVAPLELPNDYPRPAVQSVAGNNLAFRLDKDLSDQVTQLCKKEGVTLYMLFLSAFKVLLYRYSGQEDICVGSPVAGRTQAELEGMIGFFVNMLALRSDLSGNPEFAKLLDQVKATTLEAYDHQQVPFEKIVERVVKTRDRSRSPLFQVMFTLQNAAQKDAAPLALDGLTLSGFEHDAATAKLDLDLTVVEGGDAISYSINYSTDLFSSDRVQQMGVHYGELLRSIVNGLHQPIGELAMLQPAEEQQLLNEFNNTAADYDGYKTVIDLFEEQVLKTPGNTAIIAAGKKYSYQELDERSNQLAVYLVKLGVKEESLVPLCIEGSIELMIGILGILKAGAAYVPVDPQYARERIKFICSDINASVILCSENTGSIITEYADAPGAQLVVLDKDWDTIAKEPVVSAGSIADSTGLAYVIYTSGSTGQPKGVMIEHRSLYNLVKTVHKHYGITASDRTLQFASIGFDMSVEDLFCSITKGGSLVLTKERMLADGKVFFQFCYDNSISILNLPPAFWHELTSDEVLAEVQVPASLRVVSIGGDKLPESAVESWQKHYPHVTLINAYGPTEYTVNTTLCKIPAAAKGNAAGDDQLNSKVNIGKPVCNTQIYILDKQDNLVPLGAAGELCISGMGLARGYLNRQELTNEKFVTNPFRPGERMYRTGDLARWLPGGNIDFIGRKDDQVKIRGYRIELGEIENVLAGLDGIRSCCVLAMADGEGNKRLVGYVVKDEGFDKSFLESKLKMLLPEYMIPRLWVELEMMPMTSSGKIDRKGLPEPDMSGLSSNEYVAPRTKEEEQLAAIWAELLKADKIGIYDNFFELGGHSLLATRLVSRIRSIMNIEVAIKDVFDFPTIESMSLFMEYTGSETGKEFKTIINI